MRNDERQSQSELSKKNVSELYCIIQCSTLHVDHGFTVYIFLGIFLIVNPKNNGSDWVILPLHYISTQFRENCRRYHIFG
jgi:hypothetical protein